MVSTRPHRTVISTLYSSRRQEEVSFVISNGSFVILPYSELYSSNDDFGIENRHSTAIHSAELFSQTVFPNVDEEMYNYS